MGPLGFIGSLLKPVRKILNVVGITQEQKTEIDVALNTLENEFALAHLELQKELVAAQSSIIVAEIQSESWITRNWRPLLMVTYASLIVSIAFGIADPVALSKVPGALWTMITAGTSGYIVSRGLEKGAATPVVNLVKKLAGL